MEAIKKQLFELLRKNRVGHAKSWWLAHEIYHLLYELNPSQHGPKGDETSPAFRVCELTKNYVQEKEADVCDGFIVRKNYQEDQTCKRCNRFPWGH